MTLTEHPRSLARVAGFFYVIITVCALFAYIYVRGQLIVAGNMAQTADNILSHERLFRWSMAAGMIVVLSNLPLGLALYELFKVVNPIVARLALLFIIVSTTLESANLLNHFQPLLTLTLPENLAAFSAEQRHALARASIRLFPLGFSVSLSFFAVFCVLIGYLILRSRFLPKLFGVLMIIAGPCYLVDYFTGVLALPKVPHPWFTLVAEGSLALWLVTVGVNEEKWRGQAEKWRRQALAVAGAH